MREWGKLVMMLLERGSRVLFSRRRVLKVFLVIVEPAGGEVGTSCHARFFILPVAAPRGGRFRESGRHITRHGTTPEIPELYSGLDHHADFIHLSSSSITSRVVDGAQLLERV